MEESRPSFWRRIGIAIVACFQALFDAEFAAGVERLRQGPARPQLRETKDDAALQLLGLLQREGRLVDFLEEEVDSFSDAEIGAAARVVHQGCRQALHEHAILAPVRTEEEEASVEVPPGFDATAIRLVGNVTGEPPFRGVLRHRGWRVTELRLPRVSEGHDLRVIAPAEIEL